MIPIRATKFCAGCQRHKALHLFHHSNKRAKCTSCEIEAAQRVANVA